MSAFGGLILTNKGRALQAKAQAGGTALQFTKIAVGDGDLGGAAISDLTALKHMVKDLPITKCKTLPGGKAVLGAAMTNQGLVTGFYWRELGVYAQDPTDGEILYCYGNAGTSAEYIPAGGGPDIVEKNIDVVTLVGNAQNVSAVIEQSLIYATAAQGAKADAAIPAAEKGATGGVAKQDDFVAHLADNAAHDKGFFVDLEYYYNTSIIQFLDGTETWENGTFDSANGTYCDDTVNFKTGSNAAKAIPTTNYGGIHVHKVRDASKFPNGSAVSTSDRLRFSIICPDLTNVPASGLTLLFNCNDTWVTDYYSYSIPKSELVANTWKNIDVPLSSLYANGAASLANIRGMQVYIQGTYMGTVNFTIDKNSIQIVRKDPIEAKSNPFQRYVNGAYVREFTINSGEWFVGVEFGKIITRELKNTDYNYALVSERAYSDFSINCIFKALSGAGTGRLFFSIDTLNYIQCYIINNSLVVYTYVNGVLSPLISKAITTNKGDTVNLGILKNGTAIVVTAVVNGNMSKMVEISTSFSPNGVGRLALGIIAGLYSNIEALSITTLQHVYHANIADVARCVLSQPGEITAHLADIVAHDKGFNADFEYYYNTNVKPIALFQSDETYQAGAGTLSVDTANIKIGSQAVKLLENDNVAGAVYAHRNNISTMDLTRFQDGSVSATSDYIYFVLYISDISKMASTGVILGFGSTAAYDSTNIISYVISASALTTGWNYVKIAKSAFNAAGTGSWSNIQSMLLAWYTVANAQNAYVSFQYVGMIRKDPSTAAPNPFQRRTNDGYIADYSITGGEWVIANEFGKIMAIDLNPTNSVGKRIATKLYADFTIDQVSIMRNASSSVGGICWSKNPTNVLIASVIGTVLRLYKIESGVTTFVDVTLPLFPKGTIVNLTLRKNGISVDVTALIGGVAYALSTTTTIVGTGVLLDYEYSGVGYEFGVLSESISTLEHTHHASIAELAKNLNGGQVSKYTETTISITASTSTTIIDCGKSNIFDITMAGVATTLSFINTPGGVYSMTLRFTQTATPAAITFPASVVWDSGGSAPDISTASKMAIVSLVTFNSGTKFIGLPAAKGLTP